MKSFVYRWTDRLRGMYYIGVHKGHEDDGYICSQKTMLKEYESRPADFTREILFTSDEYQIAREKEIQLLTEVDAASSSLYYNKHNGGDSKFFLTGPFSEDHKRKLRRKRKPFSDEHRKNMRLAKTGSKNPMYGKKLTEAHREKIARGNKNKTVSESTCERISLSKIGYEHSQITKLKISVARKKYFERKSHEME